ncbi:MAG: protein-disulfide reductase DsbD domain-containing protein [Pseudomonadota bacterium]
MSFCRHLNIFVSLLLACMLLPLAALSEQSERYVTDRISAHLITAESGVSPDSRSISAALTVDLAPGWKTYWKSPGEIGYPLEIATSAETNLADLDLMWPAPTRFRDFDIENYGYEKSVTFPIKLSLSEQGQPMSLTADISLLVCNELCVPERFALDIALPSGTGIDRQNAMKIAEAAAQVPGPLSARDIDIEAVHMSAARDALTLRFEADSAFIDPSLFPDSGIEFAFGPPDWAFSEDRETAWVQLPVLAADPDTATMEFVLTDQASPPAVFSAAFEDDLPARPNSVAATGILLILAFAFLGGLILNVMPCVLPVLVIKLTSALKAQGQSQTRVRTGFVVSALGVMCFTVALAAFLITLRAAGLQIGWGIQFQNPIFLAAISGVVILFAANMAGLFEINLPQSWSTRLAGYDGQPGYAGDFLTGVLAAVLATPCTAPFLGTAITFALTGSNSTALAVFFALGLGLAFPYLVIAARPTLITRLPRPGKWMLTVKLVMAGLLLLTSAWLLFVFFKVAGAAATIGVLAVFVIGLGLISQRHHKMQAAGFAAVFLAALIPLLTPAPARLSPAGNTYWQQFNPPNIATLVSDEHVIFVDVTADWCLTCKTNKSLVLDRDDIHEALTDDDVVAMQADWTRPDDRILEFLQENGRFGIPFNIVYGPNAPDGIALPEILTQSVVLEALERAGE